MYSFFIAIQYLGIVILLTEIVYVLKQKSSKLQMLMLMVVFATLINFIGYLFELRSTTKEMALMAVKFIYLGKPYIVLCIFLFVLQYYKVKYPAWIRDLLIIFHAGITILVLECENNSLYYSSINYTDEGFFPHLVLGKGPAYIMFSVLVVVYLVTILALGVNNFKKAKYKIEKDRIVSLSAVSIVAAAGLLIYFSGITRGYDSTLPAYVVCTIMLFISMHRYKLLDAFKIVRDNIIDDLTDGLIVLDLNGRLLYSNSVIRRLFPDIEKDYRQVIEKLDGILLSQQDMNIEDKTYHITQNEIVRENIVYGFMYSLSDITKQHQYTVQLENQKAIAENASKAKSDFLAKMSHEIRTPINSVLGMNEMILRESNDEDVLSYAADVKSSANALLSIINEILDLSKIESGKLEIIPVKYEVDSLLNDVVHMIYIRAREKGLKLVVDVDENLPNNLFGDDIRIRQILTNLLTNAVKYTMDGTVTLRVKGEIKGEEVMLHCEIEDTGIGIKEEDLPKLYASFERIEEERNRGIEGSGLGMSIVIDLLHLMGTKLNVESVYGEGSRFWFELRQGYVDDEVIGNFEERSINLNKVVKKQESFTIAGSNILVVDDNDLNRRVFRHLLKSTKARIIDVASGFRCLEILEKEKFDIIFLDHMMPGIDGVETLHRMKKLSGNLSKDAPVIALTANAITGAREKYISEGFDDFLSKPIMPEKLEKLLKQYLGNYVSETIMADEAKGDTKGLPELEEFDLGIAKGMLGDENIIRQTMLGIYHSMDNDIALFEKMAEYMRSGNKNIGDEETPLMQYRIRVHNLKSTSATVGAMLLSKLARLVELAAIDEDINKLLTLHPILIEEMKKHKERLSVLAADETDKQEFDIDTIIALLDELSKALDDRDYDLSDEKAAELGKYEFSGEIKNLFEKLKNEVYNLEADTAIETIGTIKESLV